MFCTNVCNFVLAQVEINNPSSLQKSINYLLNNSITNIISFDLKPFKLTGMIEDDITELFVELRRELWVQTNIEMSYVDLVHRFDQTNGLVVF